MLSLMVTESIMNHTIPMFSKGAVTWLSKLLLIDLSHKLII